MTGKRVAFSPGISSPRTWRNRLGTTGDLFHPYTIQEVGGVRVGIIGQAFPYTAISHPQRFVPDLTFGIQEDHLQQLVDELRDRKRSTWSWC